MRNAKASRRLRPAVQGLEARDLKTVFVDVVPQQAPNPPALVIHGDNKANDVTVSIDDNGTFNDVLDDEIKVRIYYQPENGLPGLYKFHYFPQYKGYGYGYDPNTNHYETGPVEAYSRVEFLGYGGDDRFENKVNMHCHGDGGDDDDVLINHSEFTNGFDGGDGDDQITGGTGVGLFHGGEGNDIIQITPGGVQGNNIYGGPGDDQLVGGDGDDQVYGEAGNDTIDLGDATVWDQGYGGEDNDIIQGGDGDDWIQGGPGDDQLFGHKGNDQVYGEAGNDTIDLGPKKPFNSLYLNYGDGGKGNDIIHGGDQDDHIYGGPGDDRLYGHDGDDDLYGSDGYDIIHGGAKADYINGGPQGDDLFGEDGDDTVYGEGGSDWIYLGPGWDHGYGGEGDDKINAGSGADGSVDFVDGGTGYNILYVKKKDTYKNAWVVYLIL